MKINAKIYQKIAGEPLEIQEFDGFNVEIHSMNKNETLYNTYIPKGKMAVWSSIDGKNYKLLVEEGYHQVLKDLYTKEINEIWINYWDRIEGIRKKNILFFLLPMLLVCLIGSFILPNLFPKQGNVLFFVIIGVSLVAVFTNNKNISLKIKHENAFSYMNIQQMIGEERFSELLKDQRAYLDKFYGISEDDFESSSHDEEISDLEEDKIETAETEEVIEVENE